MAKNMCNFKDKAIDKDDAYISVEMLNKIIKVEMQNSEPIDLITLAVFLIQDFATEYKTTPELVLKTIGEGFKKGLVPSAERFYPDKENMH
jgi:hypothetical protein